ncbi:MAG: tetratricopeptide repeat protein [bacterium]|nr:tetratricopeptide repeat protein [bacterium]
MKQRLALTRNPLVLLLATSFAVSLAISLPGCSNDTGGSGVDAASGPPSPDYDALEPPLAKRLRERTAIVEADPTFGESWGSLGVAYQVHDLFDEATQCFEKAEELDPDEFRWPYFLGVAKQLGDRAAALQHFRRATELNGEHAPLHYFVGNSQLQSEDWAAADAAFARALEIEPKLIVAHLGRAKVALAGSDGEKALEHLRSAQGLGPQANEIVGLFEQAYRLVGDEEEADHQAELISGMTRLEPVVDPLWFNLQLAEGVTVRRRRLKSDHLLDHGDREGAIVIWEEAIREDPDNFDVHLQVGHVLSKAGRFDLAFQSYGRAIKIKDDAHAHLGAGNALLSGGKVDIAIRAFRKALDLDPALHAARLNLGFVLLTEGNAEEGLPLIQEACRGLPDEPDAHFNLAQAYRTANRTDEAMREYQVVIDIDGHHVQGRMAFGDALLELDRPDEAIEHFEEALHGNPLMPKSYDKLAQALHGAGRHADELASIETGLASLANELVLRRRLAWTLATCPDDAVRDGARAVEIATKLCEDSQFKAPSALHTLAVSLAEAGDFAAATKRIEEAIALVQARQPLTPQLEMHLVELGNALDSFSNSKPHRHPE